MTQFKRTLMIWSIVFILPSIILAFGDKNLASVTDQDVEDFRVFCEEELAASRQLFHNLENYQGPRTVKTVLIPLNEIWMKMDYAYKLANLYQSVHPNSAMRDVGAEFDQAFSKLETEIQMSRPIFDAVSQVDISNADPKTHRFVEKTLRDFRIRRPGRRSRSYRKSWWLLDRNSKKIYVKMFVLSSCPQLKN